MPTRAHRGGQRTASLNVKIDTEVLAESGRLSAAARISLDTYITHAVRHYNRFHALTKNKQVRWARGARLATIVTSAPETAPTQPPASKSRRRS